jgi:hypothetical protein
MRAATASGDLLSAHRTLLHLCAVRQDTAPLADIARMMRSGAAALWRVEASGRAVCACLLVLSQGSSEVDVQVERE